MLETLYKANKIAKYQGKRCIQIHEDTVNVQYSPELVSVEDSGDQIAPYQFFTFCEEIQSSLMEISCQINHQIEHNTIEIHKLEDLIACS